MRGLRWRRRHALFPSAVILPSAAIEGQRPADKPAQGNALGKTANISPSLKGRHSRCSALSGLYRYGIVFPGRCPGLACLRTVGASARSPPRCMTGSSAERQRKRRGAVVLFTAEAQRGKRGTQRDEGKSSPLRPFQKPLRLCGKIRPAQRERERGRDAAVSTARRGC